jgi:ABC-type sugar transport system ATPase subunit
MELYHRPATEFVAGFIGAPSMNFLDAIGQGGRLASGGAVLPVAAAPGSVRLGIRPEHIELRAPGQGDLDGLVILRETLGGDAYLYVRLAHGETVVVRAEGDTLLAPGETVGLALTPRRLHQFDATGRTILSGLPV